MKFLFLLVISICSTLSAGIPGRYVTSIDKESNSFEMKKRMRVDVFEFAGGYPNLENIDIDAKRKKNVEFLLTGECPLLESVYYEGSFGVLTGMLTGIFPKLTKVDFLCKNCAIDLDLTSNWQQSCEINIRGAKQNVILKLPESVGVIVYTHTGPKGKVIAGGDFKKKGWGILNKAYINPQAETSDIVLTLVVETSDGHIFLN